MKHQVIKDKMYLLCALFITVFLFSNIAICQPLPPNPSGNPVFNKNKAPIISEVSFPSTIDHLHQMIVDCAIEDSDGRVKNCFLLIKDGDISIKGVRDYNRNRYVFDLGSFVPGDYQFIVKAEDDEGLSASSDSYAFHVEPAKPICKLECTPTIMAREIQLQFHVDNLSVESLNVSLIAKDTDRLVEKKSVEINDDRTVALSFKDLEPNSSYSLQIELCNRYICSEDIIIKEFLTKRLVTTFSYSLSDSSGEYDLLNKWSSPVSLELIGVDLARNTIVRLDEFTRYSLDQITWSAPGSVIELPWREVEQGKKIFLQFRHNDVGLFKDAIVIDYDDHLECKEFYVLRKVQVVVPQTNFTVDEMNLTSKGTLLSKWSCNEDLKDYDGLVLVVSRSPVVDVDLNKSIPNNVSYTLLCESSCRQKEILLPFRSKRFYVAVLPYKIGLDHLLVSKNKHIVGTRFLSPIDELTPEFYLYSISSDRKGNWHTFWVYENKLINLRKIVEYTRIYIYNSEGELEEDKLLSQDKIGLSGEGMCSVSGGDLVDNGHATACSVLLTYKDRIIEFMRFGDAKPINDIRFCDIQPRVYVGTDQTPDPNKRAYLLNYVKDKDGVKYIWEEGDKFWDYTTLYWFPKHHLLWQGKDPTHFNDLNNWRFIPNCCSDLVVPSKFKEVTINQDLKCASLSYDAETHLSGLEHIPDSVYLSCENTFLPKRWHFIFASSSNKKIGLYEPSKGQLFIKRWNDKWEDVSADEDLKEGEGYILYSTKDTLKLDSREWMKNLHTKSYHYSLASGDGWRFVGNPFNYYADVTRSIAEFTTSFVYVYDDKKPGYQVISLDGLSLDDDYSFEGLAPHQGFFVQQTKEGDVLWDNGTQTKRCRRKGEAVDKEYCAISLMITAPESLEMDNLKIVLSKRKSVDYVRKEDATKFLFEKKGLPQIFSLALDKKLVIDQRPLKSQVIPLGFMVDKDMVAPITITQKSRGTNTYNLWIEDSYSGDIWDIIDEEKFSLPIKEGDLGDRWKLHIDVDEPEDSLAIKIFHKDHGVRIESLTSLTKQISVFNVLGEKVTSFVLEGFDDKNVDLSKGIFLLKIVSDGVITTTKIVVY